MPPRIVDIPLAAGLRQKQSEQWLDPSSQTVSQNAIWIQQNAIEKRPGYLNVANSRQVSYPPSATYWGEWGANDVSIGVQWVPSQNGLAMTDGWYMYQPNIGNGSLTWADFISPCVGTRKVVSAAAICAQNPTVANWAAKGIDVYVWEDGATAGSYRNQLSFSLVNEVTGETIYSGIVQSSTGTNFTGATPRVMMLGSVCVVVAQTGVSPILSAFAIDLSTSGLGYSNYVWTALGQINTAGTYANTGFDVSPLGTVEGGAAYFALAFCTSSGDVVISMVGVTGAASAAVAGSQTIVPASTVSSACVGVRWTSANRVWVAFSYATSGDVFVAGAMYNVAWGGSAWAFTSVTALTAMNTYTTGTTVAQVGIESIANAAACVVWALGSAGSPVCSGVLTSARAVSAVNTWGWNLQLSSKPFAVTTPDNQFGCRVYVAVTTYETSQAQNQQTQYLCEVDLSGTDIWPRTAATIAPRQLLQATAAVRTFGCLSCVTNWNIPTAGLYIIAGLLSETTDVTSSKPPNTSTLGMRFNFKHPAIGTSVEVGGLTYIAGGVPSIWDGSSVVESSTLVQLSLNPTASATGGALENGQTYVYQVVPEWRDNLGNVHEGQPSLPVSVAIPAGAGSAGSVSFAINVVPLTAKGATMKQLFSDQANMYLVLYRSVFSGGAMSTNLYRLTGDQPGASYINAVTGGVTITISDVAADSSISSNPFIYTTGGVLEADTPSSFAAITSHQNRVYGLGDDLRTIWISTAQQDGLPCYFNDGAQTEVSLLGDLIALWSMDGNLFCGNATGIAYASGSGPNITGTQSDLAPWTPVPTDVGPVSPVVCVTPMGTIYQTRFGLALLDRSLAVHSDFGDPITQYLSLFPNVMEIVLHPQRPELHVYLSSGSVGAVAVFNYRFNAWSFHIIAGDPNVVSAATLNGALCLLDATGLTYREKNANDTLAYYDSVSGANTWIQWQVNGAWVKPAGTMQGLGFARSMQMQFIPQDPVNLIVTLNYDYAETENNSVSWTSAQIAQFFEESPVGGYGAPTSLSLHPQYSRCTAIQMVVTDAAPSTSPAAITGQGIKLVALSCEVEAFEGLRRLPGAQKG